jgi:hypothetical protein
LIFQIIVKPAQHGKFSQLFVIQAKRAQRMWDRASSFGNDRGISCVRLGFASVQIRNPAHGKPGKIGHKNASVQATVIGSAPIVGGWSTTSKSCPCSFSPEISARSLPSSLGKALSKSLFPERSRATA